MATGFDKILRISVLFLRDNYSTIRCDTKFSIVSQFCFIHRLSHNSSHYSNFFHFYMTTILFLIIHLSLQVKLILREVIDERRYKAFGMLWANEADSVAILDNLPEGVVDEIAKHQHTLKQE